MFCKNGKIIVYLTYEKHVSYFFIFLGKKEIDSNIGGINSENQRLPKVITNSRNFTTCFFFWAFWNEVIW